MLALNKKVGLLSIHSAKLRKILYFDHRGVTLYHNLHAVVDRVVARLVRAGRLTEDAVEEVRDHAVRQRQPIVDTLLAGGYVDAAELDQQYGLELEEEIYALFFCRDAKFEFHEGQSTLEGRDGIVDDRFFFNCDSVIMEAARRIDEWAYIQERVPTVAEVYVPTVDAADLSDLGPDAPAVFSLLDGRHTVARIEQRTAQSTFQVCKILSQMLDAGWIAPIDSAELVPGAQGCMAEGRVQQAIDLCERAVELGIDLPEAHALAAGAYRHAKQFERAGNHIEALAEQLLVAGDAPTAVKKLLELRDLLPTQLRARERLVEIALSLRPGDRDGFDPLAEGKQLVELLLEFGDVERVRGLLESLIAVTPDDLDLKKALVNVHVKAGDQKRVIELYESIADDLLRQGRPLEAVGFLQKVLLLDRARSDVSERMRKLYEFDERARKRRRSLASLASLFVLVVVLAGGYLVYDRRAAEEFTALTVESQLAAQDYLGAANVYEVFIATHPLTTSVAAAEARLRDLDVLRERREAELTAARVEREREQKQLRQDYRQAYAQHREEFLGGKPEAALQSLAKVRELVAKAGDPQDMAWALENQVERMWQRLQEFLATAAELAAQYDAALQADDWQTARALALRLRAEFDVTEAAKRCRIPVRVVTRPAGAALMLDGRPLQVGDQAAVTPATLLCANDGAAVRVQIERAGFAATEVQVDPLAEAAIDVRLEVLADRTVDFGAAPQTGVALGEGWLAVGLRGGFLGTARIDGTGVAKLQLGGLRSVDLDPVISGGNAYFVTTENTIECIKLEGAVPVSGWLVRMAAAPATALVVRDGRVLLADRSQTLHCWEQATGRPLWSVPLNVAAAGAPTIDRRVVRIGLVDGRILSIDATSGDVLDTQRAPAGLSSAVVFAGDERIAYCMTNGTVVATEVDGKPSWSIDFGRTVADGEFAANETFVAAVAADGVLRILDPRSGALRAEASLGIGQVLGIRAQGGRAFVKMRRPRHDKQPPADWLLAVDAASGEILWEYGDTAIVPGAPTTLADAVVWPSATKGVVLFR
ncbi:MAG: hypothetical protein RL398_3668 [Planctomycetota bacterium]